MISKVDLKEYDFNRLSEYYEYIIESWVNGNKKTFTELYKDLSSKQKVSFHYYLFILPETIESSEIFYWIKTNYGIN